MERTPERRRGVRGILADISRLDVWLHVVLVVLTLASAARYVDGHGLGDRAPVVLGGATVLLACYAARPRSGRWTPGPWPSIWCLALVAIWFVLVVLAPSFAWVAVPLSFVALRVLPFAAAGAVIAFMTACVVVAWTLMQGEIDLTVLAGPVSVAWLAVVAYRALEREAASRQELVDELKEAQGNLAEAQHRAGVLAERARLSRELDAARKEEAQTSGKLGNASFVERAPGAVVEKTRARLEAARVEVARLQALLDALPPAAA